MAFSLTFWVQIYFCVWNGFNLWRIRLVIRNLGKTSAWRVSVVKCTQGVNINLSLLERIKQLYTCFLSLLQFLYVVIWTMIFVESFCLSSYKGSKAWV